MNAVDGLVAALVTSAVRRWPPASREEQSREWTAELAALREEPDSDSRRFAFALSLALSPAPDDGSGLRGWRELLPTFWARLRPAAGFAVLSVLVLQMWPLRLDAWDLPVGVLLAFAVVPLCFLVGRRSTASTASPMGIAGVAATGAALGYLVYRTAPLFVTSWAVEGRTGTFVDMHPMRVLLGPPPGSGYIEFTGPILYEGYVAASLVFVALTTPLLVGVLYFIAQRRWRVGIPLACLGLPVMAFAAWRVGVAATPESAHNGILADRLLIDPFASVMGPRFDSGPFGLGQLSAGESFVGALLLLGAMVTAYCLGLATRDRTSAPAVPPGDPTPAWTLARATTSVGWVAVVVGLAGWVYATSALPLWAGRDLTLRAMLAGSGDELRWSVMILAVLGARVALLNRRGATLAALLGGAWLLAAEAVLTRPSFIGGPLPVATAAAIAVLGVGLAWWVCGPQAELRGADATAARRTLAIASVVAAACGPLLVAQVEIRQIAAVPVGLTVMLGVVPATFVALAAFAAAAARRRPIRPARAAGLALAPVAATASAGLAVTVVGFDQGVSLLAGAAAAGLFAVGCAALALAERGRSPRPGGWVVAAVLAPFVLAPVTYYAAIVPGMLLKAISGAGPYAVATTFQPGVLLVVLPVAAVLARRLIHDNPRPDSPVRDLSPSLAPASG